MSRNSFVGFSERVIDRLRESMERLFSDPNLSMRIVYVAKGSRTFTASSGVHASTDKEIGMDAIKVSINKEMRAVHQTGTHVYYIDAKNLEGRGIVPKIDDRLKEYVDKNGNVGDELTILDIKSDPVTSATGRVFYVFVVAGK